MERDSRKVRWEHLSTMWKRPRREERATQQRRNEKEAKREHKKSYEEKKRKKKSVVVRTQPSRRMGERKGRGSLKGVATKRVRSNSPLLGNSERNGGS